MFVSASFTFFGEVVEFDESCGDQLLGTVLASPDLEGPGAVILILRRDCCLEDDETSKSRGFENTLQIPESSVVSHQLDGEVEELDVIVFAVRREHDR